MRVVHGLSDFEAPWESSALTLGVFDGLHRGHQELIKKLQKRSRGKNRANIIVTYNPHPDFVLGKRNNRTAAELFTLAEKISLFQMYNFDAVIFLPFTAELARMTALRYLREILLDKLKAGHIIIGYDQCFGRGRKGDFKFLKQMSGRYNFRVEQIRAVRVGGVIVSSTAIRAHLESGEVEKANRMLGHDFFVTGTVVRGDERGRILGFPTANLDISETKVIPGEGVYAARLERGGTQYRAMVNIGYRPTFGKNLLSVEANILDFSETIYGEQVRLYFIKRIRDEIRFSGAEALKARLEIDRAIVRKIKL